MVSGQLKMRLFIAIFGSLGSLSAQVICSPVESSVDLSFFDTAKSGANDSELSSRIQLFRDYLSHRMQCFEHLQGTFGIGTGNVHSLYVEVKSYERWISGSAFCSSSRSKVPLFRFSQGLTEQSGQETPERKHVRIPAEFCQATDH